MAEEKNNWEGRQYDSFGPHFRIDSGNPQLGYNGTVVYDLLGSGADGNTSTITAMSSGDVKVTGQNIILDADKNVEINAGGDFRVTANNTVNMVSTNMYLTAPYGKIRVREVGWMGGVFAGTKVSESVWSA